MALAILLASFIAKANVVVDPPLNTETLIGTWEALQEQHPPLLWHMEINKDGDSYVAEITVGDSGDSAYVVRRLISSEVKDGNVRLHFGNGAAKEMPNQVFSEIWVIGTGSGTETRGGLDAVLSGIRLDSIPPPAPVFGLPEKGHIYFIKGAWTRGVAEASRRAEESLKARKSELPP